MSVVRDRIADWWRKSWPPFLLGMSGTFGIFPARRHIETLEESFERVADSIEDAVTAAMEEET